MERELKTGFNSHRLIKDDPYYAKEIAYVEAINNEFKYSHNYLAQIVNHPEHKMYLTEDEEKIALSVIQWLGTPVGQGFIHKVEKFNDEPL